MPGERFTIDGGGTALVLEVGDDGRLHQMALGHPATMAEPALPTVIYPLAYPTFGEEILREPALRVTHADGAVGTRLVFHAAAQEPHGHGQVHRIELIDRVAPLTVTLCFRTWPRHDLIEQWVEVVNGADAPITLHQAASASPALPGTDPHLTHWGGGWAHEWTETTERITPGTKTVASAGGVRSSLHREPIVLFAGEGRATETEGSVLAATVAWGGDTRFDAEMGMHRACRLIAGAQHRGAERTLDPGERHVTPPAVLAWSDQGIGPITRALHPWVRKHVVRDGDRPRAVVFNNWETMFFDLATEPVNAVIDGAQRVGAELFLMDDGWFGSTHPRDNDLQGLGDWMVDAQKFPDGLSGVIDHALAAGLRFGLWVEPEMVNPLSELYRDHPDWVIAEPGRERREERQQLILDLCRTDVQAFVIEVIDRALAMHPGISYLKWDANRDVFEAGSTALAADRQAHLPMDRVRATQEVMAEVARRHPEVELMACASGGGRSDLGTLRWFHEIWTSDNTDPVDRVRIQWGASHLLPSMVLGAHVTRWGEKPVAFGCAVAMSARFGFDIDPRAMTDDELEVATAAAASSKRIRPLVQFGDLHRLVSPVDGPRAALAYLDPAPVDASDPEVPCAVVFAYRLEDDGAGTPDGQQGIAVPGLVGDRRYLVEDATPGSAEAGSVFQRLGSELAATGVPWPADAAPSARVWVISPEA
ncbi:alpha-galactosidase [Aquihabitans sp. McL0605]|uniref:alpha-galactosidase n=1 Tax=Aquihabitans sp. McL0605 TaxID=3415671 RepID=UPI003CEB7C9C